MTARILSPMGKILYGCLFMVVLPLALVFWARNTETAIGLPELYAPLPGLALVVIGAAMFVAGVVALFVYGKGAPMNAYPPERYVSRGLYRLLSHPIYVGFCLATVGVSVLAISASGFWLVSPMLILGCAALVLGYENEDLRQRFGPDLVASLIGLPKGSSGEVTGWNRLSVYLLVFLPWLLMYELFVFVGVPADSFAVFLPFESGLPVMEWTEAIYASTYLLVLVAPLVVREQRPLREFAISGLVATATIAVLFFIIPVIAPPRPFTATSALGQLLKFEQAFDTPGAAFPSFHVVWAFLAAMLYTSVWRRLRLVWYGWAIAVAVSCVTTGMHAALDVVAGIGLLLAIQRRERMWLWLLRWTERISNSWKEWRLGSVRVINHGFYAGVAALVGLAIVGWLTPAATVGVLMVITVSSLILGDLLAQLIEGSSRLLRPFGYFGALFGAILGVSLAKLFLDAPFWELMSAFTVAAPFIQTIGRLRCLVQGCCHGREAPSNAFGICYTHPTSRVRRIAGLSGRPLYPAPLYSILVNLVIGAILLRLWFLSVPLSLICGIYFLLTGFGRFVEESYRGEPQTPLFGRLHIYQWLAISSVVVGAFVTCVNSSAASGPTGWRWEVLVPAIVGGLLATFAMGVDFPDSNKRFARLTS